MAYVAPREPQDELSFTDWGPVPKTCEICQTDNDDWRPLCTNCGRSFANPAPLPAPPPAPLPAPFPAPLASPLAKPLAETGAAASGDQRGDPTQWQHWQPPQPPQAPGPAVSPSESRRSTRWNLGIMALCVAFAGAAAFGGYALMRNDDSFPKNWDSRIEPLAREAARLRGLDFKHAVKATFHTDAEFTKLVTSDEKPSTEDSQALDRYAAAIRAVGLAEGDLDLRRESNTLRGSGVLAYYDPDTKEIHVRGTEMTISVQVTLVHELTHVLQDQHFDLLKMQKVAKKNQTDAVRSLYEGDARWVENEYVQKTLTKKQQRAYNKESSTDGKTFDEKVGTTVPDILIIDQQAAYEFGSSAIAMLRNEGGQPAVDAAFRTPPTADFLLMNPIWLLEHRVATDIPELVKPKDVKQYEDSGEFGAAWWYSMLSERIDLHAALAATDGWASDTSAIYQRNDTVCVDIGWNGTGRLATETMHSALREWRTQMPEPKSVNIERVDDDTIIVKACDPGKSRSAVTHRSKVAFSLPLFRAGIAAEFVDRGTKPHDAWCAADQALKPFTATELRSGVKLFETERFRTHLLESIDRCKAQTADA